jgi:hypothetical protein
MKGQPIKLLLDEHIWEGLTEALILRGHDAVHLTNTDQRGLNDEPLLAFAAAQGRAVLTYNVRHFVPLVVAWHEAQREHAGVILSIQLPPSELLRQIGKLLTTLSADELKNTVRWLQEFKTEV